MKQFTITEAQLNAILSGVQMSRLSQLEQIGIHNVVREVAGQEVKEPAAKPPAEVEPPAEVATPSDSEPTAKTNSQEAE